MSLLNIILLSLVQGLSEFLPVSSSAHLLLVSKWLCMDEPSLSFVVALHGGSLLAICVYFYADIVRLIKGFFGIFQGEITLEFFQGLILIVATLPAIFVGFYVNKMNLDFIKTPLILGILSIVFGVLLAIADRGRVSIRDMRHINFRRGFLIGLGQAVALIPGVSRSGMTLTVARFLGISRHLAARFVFLMAIPVILGAVVLKSNDLVWTQDMFLGAGFTFIFSLIFLHGLLQFLKNYSLLPIVIYRIILGVILIVLS